MYWALLAAGLAASGAQASSKLFSGATIISYNDSTESINVIRDVSLLVVDDRIAALSSEPLAAPPGTEMIDVSGQIITPGFVDTHRHGWSTAWKTVMSNSTLLEFFIRYRDAAPLLGFTPDDVYLSQLAGLYESLNAGVTTLLDHAHHNWSPASAWAGLNGSVDSGARVFWAYSFQNSTATNYTVSQQFSTFEAMAQRPPRDAPAGTGGSTVQLGIAYDSWGPDPNRAEAQRVADTALRHNVSVLTTHSVGGQFGADNTPEQVDAFGILNGSMPVVFSHATYLSEEDADLLRSTNQYIAITPESEASYGFGHPRSYEHMDQAALGVDVHSACSGDLLTQARLWLQNARLHFFDRVLERGDVPSANPMSVNQAFYMATRAGALALRRPDLGAVQAGAKADLIVWDAEASPSLAGWNDPVAAVMLHAGVGDVLHVLVDGGFVKRDGRLTAEEYPEVRRRFAASARKIQDRLRDTPPPVLEGEVSPGVDFAVPEYADVLPGGGNGYGEQHWW